LLTPVAVLAIISIPPDDPAQPLKNITLAVLAGALLDFEHPLNIRTASGKTASAFIIFIKEFILLFKSSDYVRSLDQVCVGRAKFMRSFQYYFSK
jgi:hypothetical protein